MHPGVAFAVMLGLTVGCSSKEDAARAPSGSSGSVPTAGSAKASKPPAPKPPPAPKVGCPKVLSKALRDKYFAGVTITAVGPSHGVGEKCELRAPADTSSHYIEWACDETVNSVKDEMIKDVKSTFTEAKVLPGIGNPALAEVRGDGVTMFYVWDAICVGSGTLPSGVDAASFLKDWLAEVPRTAMKPE